MYHTEPTRRSDDARFRRPAASAPEKDVETPPRAPRSSRVRPEANAGERVHTASIRPEKGQEGQEHRTEEAAGYLRLTCTIAAMTPVFALFLCFAEKKNRMIRHFSLQSAVLSGAHLLLGGVIAALAYLLGTVPFLGFVVSLVSWLAYIVILILTVMFRIRLMLAAWRGTRFDVPVIGKRLMKYV